MKYEVLKAGDIRQEDDEVRSHDKTLNDSRGYNTDWRKTELAGLPIMKSDTMHLEYRRPIA